MASATTNQTHVGPGKATGRSPLSLLLFYVFLVLFVLSLLLGYRQPRTLT